MRLLGAKGARLDGRKLTGVSGRYTNAFVFVDVKSKTALLNAARGNHQMTKVSAHNGGWRRPTPLNLVLYTSAAPGYRSARQEG